MKKGTIEQAESLHGLVASTLIARLESDECSTGDVKNAMDWLHRHGITKFIENDVQNFREALESTGPVLPDAELYLNPDEEDVA
jgi:hypothetical protein